MRNSEIYQSIHPQLQFLKKFTSTKFCQEFDPVSIYENVSGPTSNFLKRFDNELKTYLACLNTVFRWKEHVFAAVTTSVKESNYNHILEMLKLSSEIQKLGISQINFKEIELMILIHDGGEIITGDMPLNHSKKVDFVKKIKRIEPKCFNRFILNNLENGSEKDNLRSLYYRYEHRQKNPNDLSANLVKLIDTFQGNIFGLKNVYDKDNLYTVYKSNAILSESDLIVEKMIQKEIEQTKIVLNCLESKADKQKLFDFLYIKTNHRENYLNHGYQNVYSNYVSEINKLNPLPTE